MKELYPVIVNYDNASGCYLAYAPDFEIDTFGKTMAEALEMAADAVQLAGVTRQDFHEALPDPSDWHRVTAENPEAVVSLVEVDFERYRLFLKNRTVKKNCTIPAWLEERASAVGINFSAVLVEGLKRELAISAYESA